MPRLARPPRGDGGPPPPPASGAVAEAVAAALASRKYRDLPESTVRRLAESLAPARPRAKDLGKALKAKLHQVTGLFFAPAAARRAETLLDGLESLAPAVRLERALALLALHVSTAERLEHLEDFYANIRTAAGKGGAGGSTPSAPRWRVTDPPDLPLTFPPAASPALAGEAAGGNGTRGLGSVTPAGGGGGTPALPPFPAPVRILDVACGANAFAFPFMGFPAGSAYVGLDIDRRLVGGANRFFAASGIPGRCLWRDAFDDLSDLGHFDIALILKTLPCLERQARGAGAALLDRVPAAALVVSFPARSVGGRDVGMGATYDAYLREAAREKGFSVAPLGTPYEPAYVLRRRG